MDNTEDLKLRVERLEKAVTLILSLFDDPRLASRAHSEIPVGHLTPRGERLMQAKQLFPWS